MRILAIIIRSYNITNLRPLQGIFIDSKCRWIIRELRNFRHVQNIDYDIDFLCVFLVRNDGLKLVRRLGFVIEFSIIDSRKFTRASVNIEQGRFIAFKREIQRSEISIIDVWISSLYNTERSSLRGIFSNCKRIRRHDIWFFVHINHANLGRLARMRKISTSIINGQGDIKDSVLVGHLVEFFIVNAALRLDDERT